METKAVVAFKAGQNLSIKTVNLEGPEAGEVLAENKATGLCQTDAAKLSGDDPEGLLPAILGHEGAGQAISNRPCQLVTGRIWQGSAFGGARGRTDAPTIADWCAVGKINVADLIADIMPLDHINDAFAKMRNGESIRSVVTV